MPREEYMGDPTKESREKGGKLVEAWVNGVVEAIRKIKADRRLGKAAELIDSLKSQDFPQPQRKFSKLQPFIPQNYGTLLPCLNPMSSPPGLLMLKCYNVKMLNSTGLPISHNAPAKRTESD